MSTIDYTPYKILDWFYTPYRNNFWGNLSRNSSAIHLLEQNPERVNWYILSKNPKAIHLLEQNPDKIVWKLLSGNPKAIHLLEQRPDKIKWWKLSGNPDAIHLLEQNQDKIDLNFLSTNPSIFVIDYQVLQQRIEPFKEELIAKCFHPDRLVRYLEVYNYDIGEDQYLD